MWVRVSRLGLQVDKRVRNRVWKLGLGLSFKKVSMSK